MSEDAKAPARPATPPEPLGGPACPADGQVPEGGMAHLREDLWGIFVITKREFIANIRSFRSIVMVFILALIMVGAAMGFASLTTQEEAREAFTFMVIASDPDGRVDDLMVFAYETGSYGPLTGRNVTLLVENMEIPEYMGTTDQEGYWYAKNLTPAFHWLLVEIEEDSGGGFTTGMGISYTDSGNKVYVYVPHNLTVPFPSLGVQATPEDLSGNDRLDDLMVQVVRPDGSPASDAAVQVAGLSNTTNAQGICTFTKVAKGEHLVTATSTDHLTGIAQVNVTQQATERDPFALALEGPDEVLRLVAAIAIGLVGPIYAIVLCFDSVFRERLSGSIDYLLCRPMGRRAVLAGKFTGILAALMIPISAVSLLGVWVVSWKSGQSPNTELVLGFLVYTVFLISIFTLLQMIFSTVAKTTGTAILSGIGIWIFFFMLFDLILLLVGSLMDLQGDAMQTFYTRASFLNPISIYSMAIGLLGTEESLVGAPDWAPGLALVALTIVLLLAAMEIFRRRVSE